MSPNHILDLYESLGSTQYAGEPVTQLEHAAQCGALAAAANASPPVQLAAWLHDIGHLICNLPGTPTKSGVDDQHEHEGANRLKVYWGDAVAEPVRLHVQAKRFLVSTHSHYRKQLSEDSVRSLALQGGLMSSTEMRMFQQLPYHADALRIRIWDDLAKSPDESTAQSNPMYLHQLKELMGLVGRL